MQQQYEEERLQRLVQEEAVKFLWKQVSDCSEGHHTFTTAQSFFVWYYIGLAWSPFSNKSLQQASL